MALLFEYDKWEKISNQIWLKLILQDIWKQRIEVDIDIELSEEENDNRYQPFLKIDGYQVRANNFVGFIQNGEDIIEIYPKVFRRNSEATEEKKLMLQQKRWALQQNSCRAAQGMMHKRLHGLHLWQ